MKFEKSLQDEVWDTCRNIHPCTEYERWPTSGIIKPIRTLYSVVETELWEVMR